MNRDHTLALLERLRVAQLRLAAVALVVMMCVTVVDVFFRYVFNSPIRSSYDMVEATMVLFVFNGMSTAFLQRRNIVIDLVDSFAGRRLVRVLIRLSDVLTVAVLALFIYAMLTPALQSYGYSERKLELGLPIYIEWVAALIGIAGATLCAIGAFLSPTTTAHDEPAE
jgi:TRAP-type C4-dicarboxylate transport system permease small subunit